MNGSKCVSTMVRKNVNELTTYNDESSREMRENIEENERKINVK